MASDIGKVLGCSVACRDRPGREAPATRFLHASLRAPGRRGPRRARRRTRRRISRAPRAEEARRSAGDGRARRSPCAVMPNSGWRSTSQPRPVGIEAGRGRRGRRRRRGGRQRGRVSADLLGRAGGAIVEAEGDVEGEDIEAEKPTPARRRSARSRVPT